MRPSQQSDPDMYLRVVERRKDGIVVRGAKAHTSGGVVCEELVVIAQRAMREDDRDYAVAFAIPVDTPGITLVARGINLPADPQQAPLSHSGAVVESLTIFDDVFVPTERIFLCGESEFCGDVANNFATINRHGYLGTDYGKLELFIGAAALIAEYNEPGRQTSHPGQDCGDDQARERHLCTWYRGRDEKYHRQRRRIP